MSMAKQKQAKASNKNLKIQIGKLSSTEVTK